MVTYLPTTVSQFTQHFFAHDVSLKNDRKRNSRVSIDAGTDSGGLDELKVPVSVLSLEQTIARSCTHHSCMKLYRGLAGPSQIFDITYLGNPKVRALK